MRSTPIRFPPAPAPARPRALPAALAATLIATGCGGDPPAGPPDMAPPPVAELTEDKLASWDFADSRNQTVEACAPRKRTDQVSFTADSMHAKVGKKSGRLDYARSGLNYVAAYYPATRDLALDLTGKTGVELWIDAQLPESYRGWDPPGPTIVLCNEAGKYLRLDPSENKLPRDKGSWVRLRVPLAGGAGFVRQDQGGFDKTRLNWIEIHVDPYRDNGMGDVSVWVDGLRFY